MRTILIILFTALFNGPIDYVAFQVGPQEEPKKQDTTAKEKAVIEKQVIDKIYSKQINSLDSIIAAKSAMKIYNQPDTAKIKKK